jgi:hypothetical protein
MVLLAGIIRAQIISSEPKTGTLPVADVIDAWRAREEGPCARCGTGRAPTDPAGTRYAPTAARPEPRSRSSRARHPASPAAAQPDQIKPGARARTRESGS